MFRQGVWRAEYELLDRLRAYTVLPAENPPLDKFEMGTKNHEFSCL